MGYLELAEIKTGKDWNDVVNSVMAGSYVFINDCIVIGLKTINGETWLIARDRYNKECFINEKGQVAYDKLPSW